MSSDAAPQANIKVYALLDAQSDSPFVMDSIVEELGVKGKKTQLTLTTMLDKDVINQNSLKAFLLRTLQEQSESQCPSPTSVQRFRDPMSRSQPKNLSETS